MLIIYCLAYNENCPQTNTTCSGVNSGWSTKVEIARDWQGCEEMAQFSKCTFTTVDHLEGPLSLLRSCVRDPMRFEVACKVS